MIDRNPAQCKQDGQDGEVRHGKWCSVCPLASNPPKAGLFAKKEMKKGGGLTFTRSVSRGWLNEKQYKMSFRAICSKLRTLNLFDTGKSKFCRTNFDGKEFLLPENHLKLLLEERSL